MPKQNQAQRSRRRFRHSGVILKTARIASESVSVKSEPPSIKSEPARIESEPSLTVFRRTRPIELTRGQARPHLDLTLHIRAVNSRRTICNLSGRSPPRANTMLRVMYAESPCPNSEEIYKKVV